eukprot:7314856-Alexandrium_andersonii.AAC.1
MSTIMDMTRPASYISCIKGTLDTHFVQWGLFHARAATPPETLAAPGLVGEAMRSQPALLAPFSHAAHDVLLRG